MGEEGPAMILDKSQFHSPFCPTCKCVLPPVSTSKYITCYYCKKVLEAEYFGNIECVYTVHFNSAQNIEIGKKNKCDVEGPIVERQCSKCGNNIMSYATIQLRSADEGQTIFYTCTKCKNVEYENS